MRIQSELCHIDEGRAVVLVTGWIGEKNVGSALGEGKDVEEAENRALSRLNQRVNDSKKSITPEENTMPTESEEISREIPARSTNSQIKIKESTEKNVRKEEKNILNDWSDELAEVDQEIKRLGWTKKDESEYIQRTLGIKDRTRITSYLDLTHYISNLRILSPGDNPKGLEESHYRERLLHLNDKLIRVLGWTEDKCRQYLMDCLKVSSRQHLTNSQLNQFNVKLSKQATSKTQIEQ